MKIKDDLCWIESIILKEMIWYKTYAIENLILTSQLMTNWNLIYGK